MAQANLSVVDLFSIGIGPSSSHTVGPMRAAYRFVSELREAGRLDETERLQVTLYGSLALTGRGHHTDKAVVLGLSGKRPRTIDAAEVPTIVHSVIQNKSLNLGGEKPIAFDMDEEIDFLGAEVLERHTNAMRIEAFDGEGQLLRSGVFFSIGGGFVVEEGDDHTDTYSVGDNIRLRYPFSSAQELLELCVEENLSIAEIMLANETAWRDEHETLAFLDQVQYYLLFSFLVHFGIMLQRAVGLQNICQERVNPVLLQPKPPVSFPRFLVTQSQESAEFHHMLGAVLLHHQRLQDFLRRRVRLLLLPLD